ncbi:hypothetical protein ABMA28_003285 [Loxostege sticticalis]|uniref:Reverse transcriptase domain-containing protein n=1 Tax=Loxostege sticticalis TaxID=481309 RepID=A0ABD0SY15_LOXSC
MITSSFFVPRIRLTLFHQNIASILSKQDIFEVILDELNKELNGVDVICFSETFIKLGSEKNLHLNNYKMAATFCRKERRGGTCILINKDLDYKTIAITQTMPFSFECCAVEITQHSLIIACIYRTPNSNLDTFFLQLQSLLNMLTKKRNKNIILCGDWNIDMTQNNKHSKDLKSLLSNYNIINHINQPTRKNACLDLITSNLNQIVQSKIHCLCLSDHETGQSITFELDTDVKYRKKVSSWFEYRHDMCKENVKKFINCISALSFSEVLQEGDIQKAFHYFHDLIILFFNLCFPKIRVKMINKPLKNNWFTKGIKRCCIRKRQLYLKYRLSSANKMDTKKRYQLYTKILKKCILQSQKNSNAQYIAKSRNVCKTSWDILKKYIKNVNTKNDIQKLRLNDNNKYTDNPDVICDQFNKHFINLTNKTQTDKGAQFKDSLRNIPFHHNSLYLTPINENDIIKIIKGLKNTKSTGYDYINTNIIKQCANFIAIPLAHLVNLSLVQGQFPTELKRSIVKPLHKSGSHDEVNNYRPITLIPILSKIFEKVMHDKISTFISLEKLLKNEQFGFRRGSSTTLACFHLIKEVAQNLNNATHTLAIFLDMSKAFDFVSHKLLLNKLDKYGIRGTALSWIESYLSDREQCVEITRLLENTKKTFSSSYCYNRCGVPQGSVLGPLLFLLYINDLPNVTDQQCILFADDTTLIIKCKKKEELANIANLNLKKIVEWLELNNLNLNVNKTKCIKFKAKFNDEYKFDIKCNDNNVQSVSSTKFLGITLDEFCNWKDHIDSIINKIDRFVFALRRVRQVASQEAAVMAYHGYVSSILRYGLILWGNSVDMPRAFRVQKKCIRSICGAHYLDSCKPLFRALGILPLPCLYIFEMGIFVKKYNNLFEKNKDFLGYRGRNPENLSIPPQRLALYSKNAYCMAIKIFNKLSNDLKELPFTKFKNKLFNFLMEKMYYTVNDFLNDKN